MDFVIMHYQIYRFTEYLLVHLMVPDFLGAKIYPDMTMCGRMHLVSLMPQKTVMPLKPQPSVNLAQFENTSHSMTGLALCSILTPINPFHKKNLLNTSHLSPMDVDTSKYAVPPGFRLTTYLMILQV